MAGSAFFLRIPWGAVAGESLEGVLLECFKLLLGMGGLWSSDATSPAKCLGSFLQKKKNKKLLIIFYIEAHNKGES